MAIAVEVPMNGLRLGRLAGLFLLFLICTSCGDTFRPVAVPETPPPPDPGSLHYVLAMSTNGPSNAGVTARIDVSGDTNVSEATVGLTPVHALIVPNGTRTYTANLLEDTVSTYLSSTPQTVTTIAVPPGSHPAFLATTENSNLYVANSGSDSVAIISVATNVVTATIPVGTTPVAIAETPDTLHLYTANIGSSTVSSIDPVSKTLKTTIPVGTSPVWLQARSDSTRVFVLSTGSGTVSAIDTSTDTVVGSVSVGAGANYMVYDSRRNRLYVTNPTSNTLITLDVSGAGAPVTTFTTPIAANPVSVAALADGSRLYVASFLKVPPCTGNPGDLRPCISSQVTVVNALDGTIRSTIPLQSTMTITDAVEDANSSSTTFTYTLTSGPPVQNGSTIVVSGMADAGNNGTFVVNFAFGNQFTVPNTLGVTASGQTGTGAGVVEVDTANSTGCDLPGIGVPGGVLGGARFRMFAAASVDSSRVYVASCDAGYTAIIRTIADNTPGNVHPADSLVLDLPAPASAFPPPFPGAQPPKQNPVFLLPST